MQVSNLSVSYSGVPALKNIDLSVAKGEIIGIVGESGCGKSTLLRTLMMLLDENASIDEGKINFQGFDLTSLNAEHLRKIRGNKMSMIFQNATVAMNPISTVGSHFYETVQAHKDRTSKSECESEAINLMKQLRLREPEQILKSYPFENSGGMNQRIAIAMAMMNRPSLILADEPTSALDVTAQAQVVKMLKQLKEQFQTAIIIVSHNIGVIAQLASKVGVMYDGKIVEWGLVSEVLENPQHEYTRSLIKAIPKIGANNVEDVSYNDSHAKQLSMKKEWFSNSHWILCSERE